MAEATAGAGDPGGRDDVLGFPELATKLGEVLELAVLGTDPDPVLPLYLTGPAAVEGLGLARQQTARQRHVDDRAATEVLRRRENLQLGHTAQQIALSLLGNEAYEASLPGLHLPLGETLARVIARARVEHVPVGHHALVRSPELFRGYPFVDVVDLIDVDPVRSEPPQGVGQVLADLVRREAAVVVGR